MMKRIDRQGEVLIWWRKRSGFARQRMGPKLMNCCKTSENGIKDHGKMSKRVQVLEEWQIERQKKKGHLEGVCKD